MAEPELELEAERGRAIGDNDLFEPLGSIFLSSGDLSSTIIP